MLFRSVGAGVDSYVGYGQRGSYSVIEGNIAAIVELFPNFSRVKMLRQWGGIVDVCPDACPIISLTPVKGLYFNCGWGTGGFKRSEEHTSELQSLVNLVCRLLLEKKKNALPRHLDATHSSKQSSRPV